MNVWNLHFLKKVGLYQRAVNLYLWRWIKDSEWKFTFCKELWIIPTCGGFVPMKMKKRWTSETYISQRSLEYTKRRWICTYEDEYKMQNGNLHFAKKFGLYQRAADLCLWRWIKDERVKLTFPEEVWIIPTRCGFVPMKRNKRCRKEIYISQRSMDDTNVRWICTYEDE